MIIEATCEHCGKAFESDGMEQTEICPNCGNETRAIGSGSSAPPQVQQATVQSPKESVFFQSGSVTVTNARFVVGAKTFAMRGVTSVEVVEADEVTDPDPKNPLPPIMTGAGLLLIVVGLALWLALDYGYMAAVLLGGMGVLFIVGAAFMFTEWKRTFKIVLKTAGGEVTAYKSHDQNHITKITQAFNDSIIAQA